MTRISTMQQPAVMPTATPVVPAVSGDYGWKWLGDQVGPCIGGNLGTHGFIANRSARHLGRRST